MRLHPYVLAGASAILIVSAFYAPYGWPLVFIALIPWLHAVRTAPHARTALLATLVFAVPFMGSVVSWLFSLRGYDQYASMPAVAFAIVAFGWLLVVLGNTLPFLGFALLFRAVGLRTWRVIFFAGAVWVMLEYTRLLIYNFITAAEGVANPPFFSVGFLGYPLADSTSWLQLAALGGVMLMSMVAILANLAVYKLVITPSRIRIAGVVWAILILVSFLPIADLRARFAQEESRSIKVGVISLHPQWTPDYKLKESYKDEMNHHIAQLESSDFILLPEGARYLDIAQGSTHEIQGPVIIDSTNATLGTQRIMVAAAGSLDESTSTLLRIKEILTPEGEYSTALYTSVLRLFGQAEKAERLEEDNLSTANHSFSVLAYNGVRASFLFCIEILKPWAAREQVSKDASNLLFVALSHGDFRYPGSLEHDTSRFLKVRVVEAGVPAAVSSEFSPAYVFDRYGRVLLRLGDTRTSESGAVTLSIP